MQEVSSAIETLLLVICTSDTTGENLIPLMVNMFYFLLLSVTNRLIQHSFLELFNSSDCLNFLFRLIIIFL